MVVAAIYTRTVCCASRHGRSRRRHILGGCRLELLGRVRLGLGHARRDGPVAEGAVAKLSCTSFALAPEFIQSHRLNESDRMRSRRPTRQRQVYSQERRSHALCCCFGYQRDVALCTYSGAEQDIDHSMYMYRRHAASVISRVPYNRSVRARGRIRYPRPMRALPHS